VNLLAIESATNLVGAAVVAGDHGVERSHQGGRRHAESLIPAVEEVCALAGLTLPDLDAVAVDVGPGLFTGLRVGVATAKALAQGLGLGVLGVGSLDVLAAGAREAAAAEADAPGATTVVSVVDARRGEVFVARYEFGTGADGTDADADPDAARASGPELLTPEALAASLAGIDPGAGGRLVVVGDGAVRYLDRFMGVGRADLALAEHVSSPSPLTLARLASRRLAAGGSTVPPTAVVPDYRREADARINWEQRTPPTPTDPPAP
jgi:tRNA threonylcarbamoyladenosine biosynthesis protein TsaB